MFTILSFFIEPGIFITWGQTKIVDPPENQTTLTGLKKHTNYTITVVAATSKGNGVVSAPIIVITDEDSEYNSLIHGTK